MLVLNKLIDSDVILYCICYSHSSYQLDIKDIFGQAKHLIEDVALRCMHDKQQDDSFYLIFILWYVAATEICKFDCFQLVLDNGKSDQITVVNGSHTLSSQHAITKYKVIGSSSHG